MVTAASAVGAATLGGAGYFFVRGFFVAVAETSVTGAGVGSAAGY